ncbi:MAG: hypothetical protein HYZ26_00820 [Chloroflexi bacterium]|nr:hypothetical protein [Chloroflexota bacterium]
MLNRFRNLPSPGWAQSIANHLKLVWRLLRDPRVHLLLKLLPFSSVVYFLSPFDLPLPIDDIGVVWFMTTLFVELAPQSIVAEHRRAIETVVTVEWKELDDDSTPPA